MPKKLKIKGNIREKLKKLAASFLLGLILVSLVPNFAVAEDTSLGVEGKSGDTDVGKWYTNESISLRTTTDAQGPDGQWKENANFIRIGPSSGIKIRLNIYLDQPDELKFAPNTWTGNPPRDSIRGRDRNFGFTKNFYGLMGYGGYVTGEGNSYCHEINIAKFIWNDGTYLKICEQKDGTGVFKAFIRVDCPSNDNRCGEVPTLVKSGDLLGRVEFVLSKDDLSKKGINKPGIYKLDVWPHLVINSGDTGITERLLSGFVPAVEAVAAVKIAEGTGSLALSLAEKIKKGLTTRGAAEKVVEEKLIAQGAAQAEAAAVARAQMKGASALLDQFGRRITPEIIGQTTKIIITESIGNGSREARMALSAAQEVVGSAMANGGTQAAAATETAMNIVAQTGEKALIEKGVEAGAAKAASTGVLRSMLSKGVKFIPIVGWAYTFAEIGLYFTNFTKERVPWYDTNKHIVGIQLYDTDQAALDDKDKPQPTNIVPLPQEKTGQGAALKGSGSPLLGFINSVIGIILGFIQELIFVIFYYLVAPLIQAVLSIHTYTDTFAAVIKPGWEVVRNLSNILFIVAIIAIAMGTLFRVESYQYKHLVVQLIIAALLVNFSLVIAQVILGVADTIQSQFLPNNADVIRALGRDLIVGYRSTVYNGLSFASSGFFSSTVTPFFFLALAIGSFLVFCAIAAFLVIRIVFLWVLLMLSPLAYLAGVLPSTEKYRGEWWGLFLKYVFFTPIMAFFLNLAAVIASSYKDNPVLQQISYADFGNSQLSTFVFKVASNILLLVFLFISIKVAEEFGIFGADIAKKVVEGGIMSPFAGVAGLGKFAGGFVRKNWNEQTSRIRGDPSKPLTGLGGFGRSIAFAALNPVAFAKGIKKQSEEKKKAAEGKAEAVGLEVAEQRFDSPKVFLFGGYKRNPHVQQHAKHEEDESAKGLANLTLKEVASRFYEMAMMPDNEQGRRYKRGAIKLTMSKGHIDDLTENMHTTKEGRQLMDKVAKVIQDGGLEESDVFQMDVNPDTGKMEYITPAVVDEDGNEIEKQKFHGLDTSKRRMIVSNDLGRRAMYVATFGGKMEKKIENGEETVDFELKDHEAARLLTQEGEVEGMNVGHWEYMDEQYDQEHGHYKSYTLRKKSVTAGGVTRKMWVSDGHQQKQAGEARKQNLRTFMPKTSPHTFRSSDGKDINIPMLRLFLSGAAEGPQFINERIPDTYIMGWRELDVHKRIRKDFQATHEGLTEAQRQWANDPKSILTSPPAGGIPKLRIKVKADEIFATQVAAQENKRGTAAMFQKVLKTDSRLQDNLNRGTMEIELEDEDSGSVVPLDLRT